MSQEYKVSFFKAGDYQDNYGNFWCEAAFEGVSEPVRWVVKDPSKVQVGDVVYGHIEDATSKAGKPYNRFKTDKREDYQSQPKSQPQGSSVPHSSQSTDESIARAVALKAAIITPWANPANVYELADKHLAWLQNSGSQGRGEGEAKTSNAPPATNEAKPQPAALPSGYDQAKQARDNLNQDPEVQSLMDFADNYDGNYNGEENDNQS